MTITLETLASRFAELFGHGASGAVCAPGRVNLIGEHTDYNDGFVLPIAIEKDVTALYRPRTDGVVVLCSLEKPEQVMVNLSAPIEKGSPAWANYSRGVIAGLLERGVRLSGAEILFHSTVPLGAGLSSSAALEVATALAMLGAANAAPPVPTELAALCQKAEHVYAGTPCGIMDQSISVMGQPGCALLLDCRDNQTRQIPFNDPKLVLLVADTQVKHELTDGGYASRRQQCESAARKLQVRSLRDASPTAVEKNAPLLDEKEHRRARHVVGEIQRTLAAADALEKGDYAAFGKLMYASHASLRDDFQVSCEELDTIVEIASKCPGVYGARMTGGGFGGCAIVLAPVEHADAITQAIAEGFQKKFGRPCAIFATHAAAGARAIPLSKE